MPEATPNAERAAEARALLLDTLEHLLDEVALLEGIVGRVPDAVLEGRPLADERSVKELYALVAAADRRVFAPAAGRLAEGPDGTVDAPDDDALLAEADAHARSMETLLSDVRAARSAFVERLRALPPAAWDHTVTLGGERYDAYGLARRAVEVTAERLRTAGYRLHESRLSDRPQGLPK